MAPVREGEVKGGGGWECEELVCCNSLVWGGGVKGGGGMWS